MGDFPRFPNHLDMEQAFCKVCAIEEKFHGLPPVGPAGGLA
jgi:hypothetical protein